MSATGPGHERWADTTGAYLLGAVDEDERAGFEAHLGECPQCRLEVETLRSAVESLPVSVPPVAAPPALKGRILVEVEREAALLAAAREPAGARAAQDSRRAGRKWSWRRGVPGWATAGLAVAALLIGLVAGRALTTEGGRTVTATVDRTQAPRASVELEIRDGDAMLVGQNMPAPPRGRVYQVWLKRAGRAPEPTATLFTPRRDGSAVASVPDVEGAQQVLVSTEPRGGSPAPTSTPILSARTN